MTGDQQAAADGDPEFEQHLRQRLRAAAETVPEFDAGAWDGLQQRQEGSRPTRHHPRSRRPVIAVAAAVLAAVVAGGLWLQLAPGGGNTGGGQQASCAEVLSRNHHLYAPYDTVRVPRHGRMLGHAYWCQDTGPDRPAASEVVYAVPGLPTDRGFWWSDRIWLRSDLSDVPAAIDELQAPVTCRRPTTLTGTIEQFDGNRAGTPARVPFTMGLRVRHALGRISMQRYATVQVTIKITDNTRGVAGARLADHADTGEPVRVAVVCRGGRFLATRVGGG